MKTPEDFLKEAIGEIRWNLDGSVTKAQLKYAMEQYAKYYHETEVKKLQQHGVMQGLLKQSDVSAAAKKHWSDASGSYAQEEIVQDSFEAGVWWACTQLSSSPTVGKAGGDASVSDGK